MVEEGSRAPAFTLRDQDGKEHSLAGYAGSWLTLYAFPKADTSG